MTTLWLDVKDLFDYARTCTRPSGIQRLTLELSAAMHRLEASRIGFVNHDRHRGLIEIVAWEEVAAIHERMVAGADKSDEDATVLMQAYDVDPSLQQSRLQRIPFIGPALRSLTQRVPLPVRAPLGSAAYAQVDSFRYLWKALRSLPGLFAKESVPLPDQAGGRDHTAKSQLEREPWAARVQTGDSFLALGAPWADPGYADFVEHITSNYGVRFGIMIYDLIPIVRPEFFDRTLTTAFERFLRSAIPLADIIFAISHATGRDIVKWAASEQIPLRSPPQVVPIGTGFRHSKPAPALPAGLVAGEYVLFVSTIEARKNHVLAFRAWRRLIESSVSKTVPKLVFAGRIGWMIEDLMQSLENCNYLDGNIVIVKGAQDAVLARLYTDARFTIFPSHYEGWGLPVSESLSFGKVCVCSTSTSLPEAGGRFCLYHDPDSVTDAVALYRRALEDTDLIRGMEAVIRDEHQPVLWDDCANAIIQRVDQGSRCEGIKSAASNGLQS
ncbi:glycosyltransferase family 1 protein [Bosea sp. (in: a-proteobacteria)]|uniref:glycosyltransferase family 4 protein n=1 Tax=Bosea sp. (in: a-proteobacteria) TaxID=1871050 RepID=UPI002B4720B1|nr:glycosyltransferase family 1 protein [Bosea sp. (in: a-proteobacteria)]WRH57199.1 MAG: glycosyltransferase family 1 protein [Bosea sp. (in: a-proteobacteria)]